MYGNYPEGSAGGRKAVACSPFPPPGKGSAKPQKFAEHIYIGTISERLMRNKMITLDPSAYEYASRMKNFSAWVRECLKLHMQGEDLASLKQMSEAKSSTIRSLLKRLDGEEE